ncbi:STAS domain-containing protein [Streptacidiphilus sp. PB12-B1b]|uniref:MEDS domain-containing protein n=1 Tax=Streptacidiphilus sp. PB12-B1b TaxID=2705012 RepID=UPI0015FA5597|nr:MEDS domain-containing protein [Streptacidiphilus sp. PB12-B1b]QMU77064.1 STAS domain-containing protein [Streptacidiphilus sp. PB12-B1b]
MRSARTVPTLDPVEVGDHVCWLVGPGDDFTGTARAFLSDGALFGDKVLVVGAPGSRWLQQGTAQGLVLDPDLGRAEGGCWDPEAMLGAVRREADTATREGFRALRVLARMDRVWPGGASPAEVARHELGLDALVAEGGALVVCAYHRQSFPGAALDQSVGVHPHTVGMRPVMPDFRMFSAEPDCWSVSGVVDSDGAATFRTAVSGLLSRSTTVRLRCDGLELMDAAGMQALAEAAAAFPGRRIVVEGANETVRRCWTLLGFDAPQIPVELTP